MRFLSTQIYNKDLSLQNFSLKYCHFSHYICQFYVFEHKNSDIFVDFCSILTIVLIKSVFLHRIYESEQLNHPQVYEHQHPI